MLAQVIDLILQFAILAMVIIGFVYTRKKKYHWHGTLMAVGFSMILVSFLLVMVPSLVMNYMTFTDPNAIVFDASSIVHIPFGITGLFLGAYLVYKWARNDFKPNNMKGKLLMRATAASWAANVIIGAVIFFTMPS